MISKSRVVVVLILFAVTWYILQTTSEVTKIPIKQSLGSFPHTIGAYRLSDSLQSSAEVVEMLGVDDYIQYNYVNDAGDRISLYVGYYHSVGVDGGYHSPKNCLPGGGWGIDRVRQRPLGVGIEGASTSTVSEMLIRNGDDYQVVYYWFQNRGRIIASEYWEKIYLVWDALFMGRRDGAFIRIMSSVHDDTLEQTQQRLQDFAEQVMPLFENYLPGAKI